VISGGQTFFDVAAFIARLSVRKDFLDERDLPVGHDAVSAGIDQPTNLTARTFWA
jgi:hypothetical protein